MRRQVQSGRLRMALARALATAGAATVLACGSLLLLAGGATPAAAGCGDGVTYQAGLAADGCPHAAVGAVVATVAGVALGAAAVLLARALLNSAASGGDLAALDQALVTVELVDELEEMGPTAYAGVPGLAELAERQDIADELKEIGELDKELFDEAVHVVPEDLESVVKYTANYLNPEEGKKPGAPSEAATPGQVPMTGYSPPLQVVKNPEPNFIDPITAIAVYVAAGHVAARILKRRLGGG
jgi:hypothetical protein